MGLPLPRLRLLLAEDSSELAQRLAVALTEIDGVRVTTLGDGSAAIAAHREAPFDIAVVDVGLPGASGLELVRAIRALGRSCFVVVITSDGDPETRDAAIAAGADRFLLKGRELDRLLEVVSARVSGSRSAT